MQGRYTGTDYNNVSFLSPSEIQERLLQFEQEFSDRYSKKDDYYRYANRVKKAPVPVIKPWPPLSFQRFNYRKEAMLHRHRNTQRPHRTRGPYHRDVHARLGRFGKAAQGNKHFHGPSPPFVYPSAPSGPGEVLDLYPSQEVTLELELSGGEEAPLDATGETSSPCLSDEPQSTDILVAVQSVSPHSSSSHDNPLTPLSPPCETHQRSPFSPEVLTGSDTPGDSAKPAHTRTSPTPSSSCTPEPVFPSSTLKTDQQGPKRVNLANLSSIQSANGRKLNKPVRSSSSKLFSNILASTDYSLDRPKQNFASHTQRVSVTDTRPLQEETDRLSVSIPLDQIRLSGPRSRSVSRKQRKEPIAPVRIKLTGQTWQLESTSKN